MGLPEGYTQVDYIESNGTQTIDTDIYAASDIEVEIDFACLSNGLSENAIFGASWAANGFFLLAYQQGGGLRWHSCGASVDVTVDLLQRNTIKCTASSITVNETSYALSGTGTDEVKKIILFGVADTKGYSGAKNGICKLYGCKLYKSGILSRNYIPCVNADGVVGLFDTVSQSFFGNSGTGRFFTPQLPLPDGYVRAEYIQSSGSQYINTGFTPNGNSRIVMDCMPLSYSSTFCFYCARSAVSATVSNSNTLFYVSNTYRSDYYGTSKSTSGCYTANKRIIVDNNKGSIKIGDSYTVSFTNVSTSSPMPWILMASAIYTNSAINTFDNYASMRLYSCQIYNNGIIARYFIPCVSPDGIAGLYDLVYDRFYKPYGTGTVEAYVYSPSIGHINIDEINNTIVSSYANIGGAWKNVIKTYVCSKESYTKLDYIESNGVPKIDTGVVPTINTEISFGVYMNSITGSVVVGDSAGDDSNDYRIFNYNSTIYWDFKDSRLIGESNSFPVGEKIDFIIGNNFVKKNGVTVLSGATITSFSPNYTIKFLNSSDAKGRLYYLRISENNTMIRNFVPCRRDSDGIAGLLDLVEGKFYYTSADNRVCGAVNAHINPLSHTTIDYATNAQWHYGSDTYSYAAISRDLKLVGNTISGSVFVGADNSNSAIKFIKYDYDHGYLEPWNGITTSNITFTSITLSRTDGINISVSNASISIQNYKLYFSLDVEYLPYGDFVMILNVKYQGTACTMKIPFSRINTGSNAFAVGVLDEAPKVILSSADFKQNAYYYSNGGDYTGEGYISTINFIPVYEGQDVSVTSNIPLGGDSGFLWYDRNKSFLSGNIATTISGKTMSSIPPSGAIYCKFNINRSGVVPGDLISCSVVMNESKIDDTTWLANSIVKCNSWCKAYDVRLITSEAYKAELVGSLTYSIGSVSEASYGFSQTSDGYYTSQNAGVANSAALCRITFVNTTGSAKTVTLNCINYAESSYDFGIIGSFNTALRPTYLVDSSYTKSFKGSSTSSVQTVSLTVPTGTNWIDVKYRKDSSVNKNNDSLKFKVVIS